MGMSAGKERERQDATDDLSLVAPELSTAGKGVSS